jgi:hypothetical protein
MKTSICCDDFKVPGRDQFIYDKYQGQFCPYDFVKDALNTGRAYQLSYPTCSGKTSGNHPLYGWGLLVFGHEEFQIPAQLVDKMERVWC